MSDQASVTRFVRERCVLSGRARVPKPDLHLAYVDWHRATEQPGSPLVQTVFCRALLAALPLRVARGPRPNRQRYFVGLRLKSEDRP